jgi:pre-mRNA-splicing factor SYF1
MPRLSLALNGAQFEESLLSASMEQLAVDDEEGGATDEGDDGSDFLLKDDGNDVDLR